MKETLKEKLKPAGANPYEIAETDEGKVAGFWQGLWHGMIAPVAFLISLFKEDVGVYEVHNNGRWYNFGFVIGLSMNFSGNNVSAPAKKKKKKQQDGE